MRNCLMFVLAVAKYGKAGDHLLIRKSHWGWFPHFAAIFEMADDSIIKKEYVPIDPSKKWLPPLFFKGKVITTTYRKVEVVEGEWN